MSTLRKTLWILKDAKYSNNLQEYLLSQGAVWQDNSNKILNLSVKAIVIDRFNKMSFYPSSSSTDLTKEYINYPRFIFPSKAQSALKAIKALRC